MTAPISCHKLLTNQAAVTYLYTQCPTYLIILNEGGEVHDDVGMVELL